jgi:SAM-dependent methyltransferase
MMERQKFVQKHWYDHKAPLKGNEVIQISALTHIKRLKDLFPTQKTKLSLNCGCGSGGQKDIFGPSIGMDISFENIRSLIESGGQGVVGDMEFLPFRDQTFDRVYGFGILHHLSDIKRGLSEAARVLKNGGYIGFGGENNGWCPLTYIMALIYRNWKIEKGFYRIREGNLRRIFRELGIREFKISRQGMTIYGMGQILYQLTSIGEKVLSRFKLLNAFSGYCYVAGRKASLSTETNSIS